MLVLGFGELARSSLYVWCSTSRSLKITHDFGESAYGAGRNMSSMNAVRCITKTRGGPV